jgi:hypothetical protein
MSYGIKTFDASGRVQFDTSRGADTGLVVIDAGTASSISNVPDDARVFVNLQPANTKIGFVAQGYSGSTISFYGTATSQAGNFDGDLVSVNYIVARPASSLTYTGNTYGFQSFNDDGDVLFDSRYLAGDGGFAIAGYSEPQDHNGDTFATASHASNRITTDKTIYVDIANTFVGTAGNNTGTRVKGRYIVFANNYTASASTSQSLGYRQNLTGDYNGTLDGIYFYRMRAGPQQSHIAHPNPTSILYGDEI